MRILIEASTIQTPFRDQEVRVQVHSLPQLSTLMGSLKTMSHFHLPNNRHQLELKKLSISKSADFFVSYVQLCLLNSISFKSNLEIHLAPKNSYFEPHICVPPVRKHAAQLRKFLWLHEFFEVTLK